MHRDKSSITVVVVCTAIYILCKFVHSSEAAQQRWETKARWLNPARGFDLDSDARKHFGNLTQAEKTLLRAVRVGDAVVLLVPSGKARRLGA